jgi:lipase maturation factor 1
LLLFDDAILCRSSPSAAGDRRSNFAAVFVFIFTFPLNLWLCWTSIRPEAGWPRPIAALYGYIEPFRIANSYGLFRVMTKERPEIEIEGSADGIEWSPYEFRWKPGDIKRAPQWNAPHQPRLDWQMWFAALGSERDRVVVAHLIVRLLENEPAVTRLLARNPFAKRPPRYVRALLYKYEFASSRERRETNAWWKRREVGEYFPEAFLRR